MTERIREMWDRFAPGLEEALRRGNDRCSLEQVWQAVEAGALQFWPGSTSAIVTRLVAHPGGEVDCHIYLATGTLDELEKMLVDVEHFARANTATRVTVTGRKGWERSFLTQRAGYRPQATVFTKDLANEQGQYDYRNDHSAG